MESSRASTIPTIGDSSDRQWFHSYRHLRSQSKNFELFHNKNHRYKRASKSKTLSSSFRNQDLPQFCISKIQALRDRLHPGGTVSSFVSSGANRIWDIFGEHFKLPKDLSTLMSEPKLLRHYIQIQIHSGKNSSCRCLINCPNGYLKLPGE